MNTLSWGKSARKGAWGAVPVLPTFVVVWMVKRWIGLELSEVEALALYSFVGALAGFLVHGLKNVAKNLDKLHEESKLRPALVWGLYPVALVIGGLIGIGGVVRGLFAGKYSENGEDEVESRRRR